MALKPQDVLVLLELALYPARRRTVRALAADVGLSAAETVSCTRRLARSRLLGQTGDGPGAVSPLRQNIVEFLVHGLKYVFPPERAGLTRGVPTAHAAPVLRRYFALPKGAPMPVWPDSEGKVRGEAFAPLYPSVVRVAAADQSMYATLALIDAIRGGSARERQLAATLLEKMIMEGAPL
jgi:hypothetical protein